MTAARTDSFPDFPCADSRCADCHGTDSHGIYSRWTHSMAPSPTDPPGNRTTKEPAPVTDVTELMAAKKILDEAKRLLITVGNLTESEAHRWIQKTAMNRRTAKQEIAVGIIEAFNEKI